MVYNLKSGILFLASSYKRLSRGKKPNRARLNGLMVACFDGFKEPVGVNLVHAIPPVSDTPRP
jgi:hypothetical protein